MVEYKSIDELLNKGMNVIANSDMPKEEKKFLIKLNSEMCDYARAPDAEDEVKGFYEKICDGVYKSVKELLNDARCLLIHSSNETHYPHLRDNSLKLIKEANTLINKHNQQKKGDDSLLVQHMHFHESMKGFSLS